MEISKLTVTLCSNHSSIGQLYEFDHCQPLCMVWYFYCGDLFMKFDKYEDGTERVIKDVRQSVHELRYKLIMCLAHGKALFIGRDVTGHCDVTGYCDVTG